MVGVTGATGHLVMEMATFALTGHALEPVPTLPRRQAADRAEAGVLRPSSATAMRMRLVQV